jgi:hypothetical protein
MLSRLNSKALLQLRDRARAVEQSDSVAAAGLSTSSPTRMERSHHRPPRVGGKATVDVLQELYLKARIREVEVAKREEEMREEEAALRARLAALPPERPQAAIAAGWDGLQELLESVLGDGSWARAVNSVPDDWEEEEALEAISGLLRSPRTSQHMWLLAID